MSASEKKAHARPRGGAGPYFALALGWSGAFWIAAAATGREVEVFPASLLFYLGGAGPPLAAIALTHLRGSRGEAREFWLRIADPRRMSPRWIAVALLLHPALFGLAVLADVLTGSPLPPVSPEAASLAGPLELLGLALFLLWFGPLPEEIGWRGYALDRLQSRTDALTASLALGVAWALWHVPLFFIEGTFQSGLGVGTSRFWIFLASLLPLSVLMTWVYNHTERSTLSAVLVHFSGNLTGALLGKADRLAALELIVLSAAAVAVTFAFERARPSAAPGARGTSHP